MREKPLVKISEDILNKIKYTCNKIPNVEWSGILLYEYKETEKDLIFDIKDIIIMSADSSGSTEFQFNNNGSDRHMDYCLENEEALYWKIGLIHSHNKMNSFFSSTDDTEIKDNANKHIYYLSVVVNNNMDIVAKISYIIKKTGKISLSFLKKNDKGVFTLFEEKNEEVDTEEICLEDCKIIYDFENIVNEKFSKNVSEVIEEKSKKVTNNFSFNDFRNFDNDDYDSYRNFFNNKNRDNVGRKVMILGDDNKFKEVVNYSNKDDSYLDIFKRILSLFFKLPESSTIDIEILLNNKYIGKYHYNEFYNSYLKALKEFKIYKKDYDMLVYFLNILDYIKITKDKKDNISNLKEFVNILISKV